MNWHTQKIQELAQHLKTNPEKGLSENEALSRLKQYGLNQLEQKAGKSLLRMFAEQLNNALIYVLFAAVIVTVMLQEYIDAVIILVVIAVNAVLGVYQEKKAGKALESLQQLTFPKSTVKRDGKITEIDASELVPGDLVMLQAGQLITADLRLTESNSLQVEESALTGESVPVDKDASEVLNGSEMPIGDRINMAFMNTTVTHGRGEGVVVATGMQTEIGKIANLIGDHLQNKTPLELKMAQLGRLLSWAAGGICVFIILLSLLQGRDLAEMFLTAVSLAVASIPEGLVAIVAVVLSMGVTRMSKNNAIVKKLPAVETLGSVNMICTDKTGTLTLNKMTVTQVVTSEGAVEITRAQENEATETAQLLAKGMVLASDATLDGGQSTGDPTEIALLMLADDLMLDRTQLRKAFQRVSELPFDSIRKMMSVLVKNKEQYFVFTKGALGSLLKISTHFLSEGQPVPMTDEHRDFIKSQADGLSDQALRTLALGYKVSNSEIPAEEMEKDLIFIGLTGMLDPPREEARPSIEKARKAGITTIMITGDHKNTAFAIGAELGIASDRKEVLSGTELDKIPEDKWQETLEKYRIFARVSPEHKVKIVNALKKGGNIVSMTGDGVNDAPSLQAADIGIAMGITGTDVAKGAADIILTDDNFSTIVKAVEQGRNIYSNIKKAVIFLLTCNLGEVVAMIGCLLLGWPAPLLATQLLWINLVTDSLPAIALGMDPDDPEVMKQKPRASNEGFFSHGAAGQIISGGLLIGALTGFAYWFGFHEYGFQPWDEEVPETALQNARTLAFMVLVCAQLFYSLAVRSQTRSVFQVGLFTNLRLAGAIVLGILLQIAVIYIPVMREAFRLKIPDGNGWFMIILLGTVPLMASEILKIIKRLRLRNPSWS